MASVYRRGTKWAFVMDIGYDEEGKRKRKFISGFLTRREAEEAAAKAKLATELPQNNTP